MVLGGSEGQDDVVMSNCSMPHVDKKYAGCHFHDSACVGCFAGSYKDVISNEACTLCGPGKYSENDASDAESSCSSSASSS